MLAAIYLADLGRTPVYFGGDEAHFAVGGEAIATTGRNLNGDRWPVFFNLADPMGGKAQAWGDTWYQPVLFYLVAIVRKVLPLGVVAARLPVALIAGVVTPLLLFAVAMRMMRSWPAALAATLITALAPTQVVLGRQALDYIMPIPVLIGWLWCLTRFMDTRRTSPIVVAGLCLGLGCYTYIASWALMPVYLLITWILVWRSGAGLRPIVLSAVAFAVPISIGLLWIVAHPEMLAQTFTRYDSHEGPTAGVIATYISVLHPNVLFVRGGPSLVTSTARSGFILLPFAVLLAAGTWELARRRDWMAAVIVAGIVTAPIPAAFKAEPGMIQRAMYLLPFLALLGAFGFAALWQSRHRWGRACAVIVMVAAPIQFAYFYFDYFTHYKLRSAFYYDPAAFRDVAEELMRRDTAPAYYFTTDVDDASVKWRFYTTLNGRPELLARTAYVEPDATPQAPPGSLLVTYEKAPRLAALASGGWHLDLIVKDADNRPAAAILRRVQ